MLYQRDCARGLSVLSDDKVYLEYDLSPSLEDYLEEIYRFSLTQPSVRVSDIGGKLKVSAPSVSKALRKLKSKEYIMYRRYGDIYLTDWGRTVGRFLVERNRILQDFLYLIEADCNISEEAEAMEHYLSRTTIYSIQSLVNFVKANPNIHVEFKQFLNEKSNHSS